MTYLQALYGSQYNEITQRGKDGNAGRLNGNLFLSAFIILLFMVTVGILYRITSDFNILQGSSIAHTLEFISGKALGRILAIPLLFICYMVVSHTVGNQANYQIHVSAFMQYPNDTKEQANKRILLPFAVVLVVFILLIVV